MINVYTGQYKKKGRLNKFNMIRYTAVCIVLDYFCYMNSLQHDIEDTVENLTNMVFNKSSFRKTEENINIVHTAIVNMHMMGLIFENHENSFAITDQVKVAYINQSNHIVAANLYQAKASQRLSIVAIIVALIGIILSIVFYLKGFTR